MSIFDVLSLVGGLCLFLFGMNIMGEALERRAGSKLHGLLSKLTTGKIAGLLTGLGVTAVIQSSSATTVMVVGFVNSGLMTLKQAINVIMGANIGTTVTAWIISLGGIEGDSLVLQLLKPMSFTPVLALIGIVMYMFSKDNKKKDTGMIFLGFATLMYGMDTMTNAVSGLADVPQFQQLFLLFQNPVLGVVAGAVLTAIIQSSSASVGILQALAVTGQVSFGAAIPIIMGQNIGTCITAILSSFGTNKNAKRAAMVHLSFNVIGTVVWLTVFSAVRALFDPALFYEPTDQAGIAVAHSTFNILCTCLLLPMSGLLEKLAYRLVPEGTQPESIAKLDERLLATPALAIQQCQRLAGEMAVCAEECLVESIQCLRAYSPALAKSIREKENKTDKYEDMIGDYLVKLSIRQISDEDSEDAAKLLRVIGDLERIADHAQNLAESAEEIADKKMRFSQKGEQQLELLFTAVCEIMNKTNQLYVNGNTVAYEGIDPLEEVIDELKEKLRADHIARLQRGECSIEAGFVWSDILTDLERISDHCSAICTSVMQMAEGVNIHAARRSARSGNADYQRYYDIYTQKYLRQVNKQ